MLILYHLLKSQIKVTPNALTTTTPKTSSAYHEVHDKTSNYDNVNLNPSLPTPMTPSKTNLKQVVYATPFHRKRDSDLECSESFQREDDYKRIKTSKN